MNPGGVVVMINYQAKSGQELRAGREIADLVAIVLQEEPECGGITILQDLSDPARFTLVEAWPSRESYLGPHMQTSHLQAFIQRAGDFMAGPPEISFWGEYGRGSAA